MANYYVNNNAQPTGEHEVHHEDCRFLPTQRTHLGYFASCNQAMTAAIRFYRNVDGCKFCSPACHTR
ncbi:hypothetical protein [Sulfurovum sp.]|uniref:hypothetical protein n=1 Tax=Sulfurovum sp. TaxID=1969726 RepID=UPI00356471A4